MKSFFEKIFYFIPPVLLSILYILSAFLNKGESFTYWLLWPLILLLAGMLLKRNSLKGAVLALIPSVNWIYLGFSKKDAPEAVFGMILTAFYIFCIYHIKKHKNNDTENNL